MKDPIFLNRLLLDVANYTCLGVSLIIVVIYVTMRPVEIGTDTEEYVKLFESVRLGHDHRISEPVFIGLIKFSSFFTYDHWLYFFLVSFLSIFLLIYFYYRISSFLHGVSYSGRWAYVFLSTMVTLSFPIYHNLQINVVRLGIAIPLFFLGCYYLFLKKKLLASIFIVLSILTHYTMAVFAPFLITLFLTRKVNVLLFVLFSLLYAFGVTQSAVESLLPVVSNLDFMRHYMKYTEQKLKGYASGIRLDFLAFTALFFFLGLAIKSKNALSNFLLNLYVALTFPFLLLGYISYSDRLLTSAWSLIPAISAAFIASHIKFSMELYWLSCIGVFYCGFVFLYWTGLL